MRFCWHSTTINAHDVSSKRASYHYIQIDADVTVRHGHILLKITDDELAKVEVITRQVHRPAVYLWRDGAWLEFPNLKHPEYVPVTGTIWSELSIRRVCRLFRPLQVKSNLPLRASPQKKHNMTPIRNRGGG